MAVFSNQIILNSLIDKYDNLKCSLSINLSKKQSDSYLIIGPKGSGKTFIINYVIDELASMFSEIRDNVLRIDGFIQTNPLQALFEIVKKIQIITENQESGFNEIEFVKTFIDKFTENRRLLIIVENIDVYLQNKNQNFIYSILDLINNSFNKSIILIASTQKINILECMEKRVKSRFSHRIISLFTDYKYNDIHDLIRKTINPNHGSYEEFIELANSDDFKLLIDSLIDYSNDLQFILESIKDWLIQRLKFKSIENEDNRKYEFSNLQVTIIVISICLSEKSHNHTVNIRELIDEYEKFVNSSSSVTIKTSTAVIRQQINDLINRKIFILKNSAKKRTNDNILYEITIDFYTVEKLSKFNNYLYRMLINAFKFK